MVSRGRVWWGAMALLVLAAPAAGGDPDVGAGGQPPPGGRAPGADGPGDRSAFQHRYRVGFRDKLPYDPLSAAGLDLLDAAPSGRQAGVRERLSRSRYAPLTLDAAERKLLARNGFAVLRRPGIKNFMSGYTAIYGQHLPVYISADSILYTLHRSYDAILVQLEGEVMIPTLDSLLDGMRDQLRREPPGRARGGVDDFLAVALGLLRDEQPAPVTRDGKAVRIAELLSQATHGSGLASVTVFGSDRQEDFSQFVPRGHYAGKPALEQYFRAIMWLGRIDAPFLSPGPGGGAPQVDRAALEAILLMRKLLTPKSLERWRKLDAVVTAFVGENDSLTFPEVDRMLAALGIRAASELARVPDATLAATFAAGGFGQQRISSHILWEDVGSAQSTPTPAAFAFFGQRYTPDSDVLGQVVHDRIPAMRIMPSPLDAAFVVLRNDHAAALLDGELATFRYAGKLGWLRAAMEPGGGKAFTDDASLYNLWLAALRELSPHGDLRDAHDARAAGLPSVARTEPWARRLENTQLASWAELRHNTVAYAKQSYGTSIMCEFPDAFVDPYPDFFRAISAYARKGATLVAGLALPRQSTASISDYFGRLQKTADRLAGMADKERRGLAFDEDDRAFVNDTVVERSEPAGCVPRTVPDGWYPKLFFDQQDVRDYKPTIADVHTQPTDGGGNPLGMILHVGTGPARPMVVTVDTCGRPRAFVGVVSSYFEKTTTNFDRLTDDRWRELLEKSPAPEDVGWMKDLLGP